MTDISVEPSIGRSVLQYCDQNYGERIASAAKTAGYVDHRWVVGCGAQCLQEFLRTNVSFVEAEVATDKLNTDLHTSFLETPGKYRYYVAQAGDPNCKPFESIFGRESSVLLKLSDSQCFAVQKIESFSADYSVERAYTNGTVASEQTYASSFRVSSTIIRDRRSKKVIAENTSTIIDFEMPGDSIPGGAQLICKQNQNWRFLPSVITPEGKNRESIN